MEVYAGIDWAREFHVLCVLDPFSNVADVYVGYVRRKLQAAAPGPLIHTVRGVGYILKQEMAP